MKTLAYDMLAGKLPLLPAAAPDTSERRRPRAGKKSRSYVKGTLAPLSELFNHAIEDGHYAGVNPALRVLRRSRTEEAARRETSDFLTSDELPRLLTACATHYPAWYAFVLFLSLTGARLGEAIVIQWSDLDLEVRAAEIRGNIVDGKETTPKSGKSGRVDLSGRLAAALRAHPCAVRRRSAGGRHGRARPWVFAGAAGKPKDPDNFRKRVWPKILAKAELRTIRIHDLRHTFASLLITQGESPVYVKDQLGRHGIRLTVDTYGHLVPGGNRAAVDRLDILLSGPRRTPAGPHTGRPESQAAQVRGLPSGAEGS